MKEGKNKQDVGVLKPGFSKKADPLLSVRQLRGGNVFGATKAKVGVHMGL